MSTGSATGWKREREIKGVGTHLYRWVNQPFGGNVKIQTDAKGKVTTMAYDPQNRLVSTTDRLGGVTLQNYSCCQLVSIVDAENQMTAYAYNARGEKIRETLPDHVSGAAVGTSGYGIVDFLYDEAGRIKHKTDQAGDTCIFNYDLAGQPNLVPPIFWYPVHPAHPCLFECRYSTVER